ncbi:MAG: hypothetical protein ACRDBH_00635 [Bosea sp. (in: a-proteobacteria)]
MYQYQPVNPLNAFVQSYQLSRGIQDDMAARQKAEIDKQNAQVRQQSLQSALANLRANPTPQAMADFQLQFPEMAEPTKQYFDTLEGGKKATIVGAARDVLIAQRAGGNVLGVFERYAEAAENSRDPETAKIFRDAAEVAKVNPEGAADTARILLATADKDAYGLLYSQESLSPKIREYRDRVAQFGQRAADAWIATEDTKLVPVQPGGTVYEFGPGMVIRESADQTPPPAASRPPSATLTMAQFKANVDAIGPERASRLTTRNGIAIEVKSPAEANSLPPGTLYVTPDGEAYTR